MTNWMAREGARLVDNGYRPLPVWPGHKAPAVFTLGAWREMADWPRYCERAPTELEIDHWSTFPEASIGIAGGNVVGIDIDLLDHALSYRVAELAKHILGDTQLQRIGLSPKQLLVYKTEQPFQSLVAGKLEVLCLGRQFVAYGRHPDTGRDYHWPISSPSEIPLDQLPCVTQAMVQAFLTDGLKLLPPEMRTSRLRAPGQPGPGKERAPRAAIEEALRSIPNNRVDYHWWIAIGMAIHEALDGDGLDLWHQWSAVSPMYDAKATEKKWPSFGRYSGERVGAGSIFEEARRNGWIPSPGLNLRAEDETIAEAVQVDFASICAGGTTLATAPVAEPQPQVEPKWTVPVGLPGWRRDLSGGLKLFVDHADASAKSPQPWLALGAGLAAFGVLAGRRYAGPTDCRTNLYAIGIAESTGGKDHPLRCITSLLAAAEQDHLIGGSKMASGAAIISALERSPSVIFPTDEIGFVMQAVADRKRAPKHASEIIDNMTELYSCAPHLFHGTAYANLKEKPRAPIHQPNFCLFGVTTPQVFWSALSSSHVQDGSLARMLVFESDTPFPDRRRHRTNVVPGELVMLARSIASGASGHDAFPSGNCAAMAPRPYSVPYADQAAEDLSFEIEDHGLDLCRRERRDNPSSSLPSIIGRLAENAYKVALVRAIANDPTAPIITRADLSWAYDIVENSMGSVIEAVRSKMADTPAEAEFKRVLRIIQTAGSAGISKSDLINATPWLPGKRRRDEIVSDLIEGGLMRGEQLPTGGRPGTIYYAL